MDKSVSLVVIATPAGVVVSIARGLLSRYDNPDLIVTDTAGVKGSIVQEISDGRFLAGHPMAGSELRGFAGARADLFEGATWILTPSQQTPPETYGRLHGVLRELGANVVAVSASDHDRLVALASHVPHLVAGSLMNEAMATAEDDAVLLQLAAGGFRDMTRIAAGDPSYWPDVLLDNRQAIAESLELLQARLSEIRNAILTGDRECLTDQLTTAAIARRALPGRALQSDNLAHLRVEVSDEPGVLARVTTMASELGVNIYDIEIAHRIDGVAGTLLLAIDGEQSNFFQNALVEASFRVALS